MRPPPPPPPPLLAVGGKSGWDGRGEGEMRTEEQWRQRPRKYATNETRD